MDRSDSSSPAARMRDLIMGFRSTQLLYVAARLRLADHLRAGLTNAQRLAAVVGAEPIALRRTLRALAALGVLAQLGEDEFALTTAGELLCSEREGSLHGLADLYGEPWLWQAYGALLDGVCNGGVPFERVHGRSFFEYLEACPRAAARFDAGMSGYSKSAAAAIADALGELSELRHIVDVGGGRGVLLGALLGRHPRLSGSLFDREAVIAAARVDFSKADFAPRADCVAGDFFERVQPVGADAYLLKSVIHDWDDTRALAILARCRLAMAQAPQARSRLLLIERLLAEPDDLAAPDSALFDINMLVVAGGRERSVREYAALLSGAGLRLERVTATGCALSIIEAVQA